MLTYRKATMLDALIVGENLREADRIEIGYTTARNPVVAVRDSWACSDMSEVAVEDGQPICIWGVAKLNDRLGIPWMLGTDAMLRHSRPLVARARPWVDQQCLKYKALMNYVHAGNTKSIRWLKALGFIVDPAEPYGAHGKPFHKFYKTHV